MQLSRVWIVFVGLGLATAAPCLGASAQATLQKILQLEDQRKLDAAFLSASLSHRSQNVREAALLAIGRIGDPTPLDAVVRIISSRRNPALRAKAAFALSLLEDPVSPKILSQNLAMHSNTSTQGAILTALGRMGEESTVKLLASRLEASSPRSLVADIAEGLGLLWSKDSVQWAVPPKVLGLLGGFAKGTGDSAEFSAFAISRFKGGAGYLPEELIIKTAQHARSLTVKTYLYKVLKNVSDPRAKALLASGLTTSSNQGIRVESAKSLVNHPWDAASRTALLTGLTDRSAGVRVASIQTLKRLRPKDEKVLAGLVGAWRGQSDWVKGEALQALAALFPKHVPALIGEILKKPQDPQFKNAVRVLGTLGGKERIKTLTEVLNKPAPLLVHSAAVQAVMDVTPKSITPELKKTIHGILKLADPGVTTLVAQLAAYYNWREFAEDLKEVYPRLSTPEHLESKVAVLNALAQIGNSSHLSMVKSALSDPDRLVIQAAATTLSALGAGDFSGKVPLNSKVRRPTPSLATVQRATGRVVLVKTTRGQIKIRLLKEAPLAAHNFVTLAKKGFYNGTAFHRVVPNFVVQGGDPRGDGYGGPGYFIRDEISSVRHERGMVGLATAGKDTGGSQFFINLTDNHHLNRRYTVFAKVISGLTVADNLEQGDKILSATVL